MHTFTCDFLWGFFQGGKPDDAGHESKEDEQPSLAELTVPPPKTPNQVSKSLSHQRTPVDSSQQASDVMVTHSVMETPTTHKTPRTPLSEVQNQVLSPAVSPSQPTIDKSRTS